MPPTPQRLALALLFLLVAAGLVLAACLFLCVSGSLLVPFGLSPQTGPVAQEDQSDTDPVKVNIRFGMPAPAKADPGSREAYLISRPQYVLSYNAKTRTPNQVCWRLRAEDIGTTPRSAFEPDPALPKGVLARVSSRDYDGAGFDRGHMCPAKDRSAPQRTRPRSST